MKGVRHLALRALLARRRLWLWAVLLVFAACSQPSARAPGATSSASGGSDHPPETAHEVALYFPGPDGRLHAERHALPRTEVPEAGITELVAALLAGPRADHLWPPLPAAPPVDAAPAAGQEAAPLTSSQPVAEGEELVSAEGVRLASVYLLANGTVVLDLVKGAPLAIGSDQEELSLYSLVNTILLNTPGAERMIVLWNGRQMETFAGHIDTARPLLADHDLIGEPVS